MDNLFFALWKRPGRKAGQREIDWPDRPPSGFDRLLAAVAIIVFAVCLLDHVSGKAPAGTLIASSYVSSQQGR